MTRTWEDRSAGRGVMYVPLTITFRNRCGLSSMLEWKL
jgi:hypothetical protein